GWGSYGRGENASEYSSCPEGHYDGLTMLAGLRSTIQHRNTPPARKGITTWDMSLSTLMHVYIGILLLPGRALRLRPDLGSPFEPIDRNTPPARKGITTR